MTLRNAPLSGQDGASCSADLPDGESGIFFAEGLDRNLLICPPGKFVEAVQQIGVLSGRRSARRMG
jgi:hypothetical protein